MAYNMCVNAPVQPSPLASAFEVTSMEDVETHRTDDEAGGKGYGWMIGGVGSGKGYWT